MSTRRKILVIQAAALGHQLVEKYADKFEGLQFNRLEPVFPAVTCTVQATMRTASLPSSHGMIANGLYFRELKKCLFWEQASSLVEGERSWFRHRASGGKVGMMFWQQSLGEQVDLVVSPKPVHKHGGGMVQDVYTQPPHLYEDLKAHLGSAFNLMHYWGPLASHKSSAWITSATETVLAGNHAPDLLFTYLPHLDYDLQRHGPDSPQAAKAVEMLSSFLKHLRTAAEKHGYEWIIFGDYAIEPVTRPPVFPNRLLHKLGLLSTRVVNGRHYPDLFASRAFAMVDHQVAHVYFRDIKAIHEAREIFGADENIANILQGSDLDQAGIRHERSGQLVLEAARGSWFAYPWWSNPREAPDFATHVDIHNKPGYDPCELFFGWPPLSVSQDVKRVKGCHGRRDESLAAAWCSSTGFSREHIHSQVDLAGAVQAWISP